MYQFFKERIGDLLSLISGNNDEDYEPTKDEYLYFWLVVGCIILFAIASSTW